nr:uncharacterized protein LOC112939843 isoform X1 [Oryza sativa Japonica Group]XP_025883140.1 uncharacterized protein LOC112939843 isoform X1 [Oryza sativa Japonica Group]XP_025883141.1 uncharacterized protein LOC112939843 isoform X1 [Oryza sativa Japonica Group]XP_025883142.1 uncharacterized protein LOC112939843 isoform X1 [Oryza sativa Japonica Group]XP_025883143.1 uncharacterized protein LOC112939843 isoform X1 [Oryza sativa Japonica Group]
MFTSFVLHSSNPADENHPTYHIRLPSFLHLRIAPCAATPHPHGHTSLPYALIPFPLARRANLRRQSVVDLRNKHPRRHRQPLPAPPPDRRDRSLRCRLRRSLPAPPHLTHNSLPHALIPFPLAHRADLRRQSIVDPHNQRPWWQSAIDPCHHAVSAHCYSYQQLNCACNDFAWTDAGVESSAFHDGGPIEEAPCISSRRPSCKQSGRVQGNKGTFFLSPSLCNQGLCFRVLQEGAPSS